MSATSLLWVRMYTGTPARIQRPGYKSMRTARILEPDMVITLEPGYSFGLDARSAIEELRVLVLPKHTFMCNMLRSAVIVLFFAAFLNTCRLLQTTPSLGTHRHRHRHTHIHTYTHTHAHPGATSTRHFFCQHLRYDSSRGCSCLRQLFIQPNTGIARMRESVCKSGAQNKHGCTTGISYTSPLINGFVERSQIHCLK
jgi:hypothetical protein